ncbi:hypothetical protein GGX14DRAFT_569595 [Mycena pura]|uniref:Uncharacterized protein n=1 Tax=Mycena pura TaxID=153505 RepID=A0AAD6V9C8_9AGAR|nr:hypothetical protein GGX14DRAFT_569595 [Mycena pura]
MSWAIWPLLLSPLLRSSLLCRLPDWPHLPECVRGKIIIDDAVNGDLLDEVSKRIYQALESYMQMFISWRFPPPQPIWRMKELDNEFRQGQLTAAANTPLAPLVPVAIDVSPALEPDDDLNAQIENFGRDQWLFYVQS